MSRIYDLRSSRSRTSRLGRPFGLATTLTAPQSTARPRGGALLSRLRDLDACQCPILLREKRETMQGQSWFRRICWRPLLIEGRGGRRRDNALAGGTNPVLPPRIFSSLDRGGHGDPVPEVNGPLLVIQDGGPPKAPTPWIVTG